MSILKLLGTQNFDVNTTIALASAFDTAWLSLQKEGGLRVSDGHTSGTRELLAQRLVDIAALSERDKQRLVDGALIQFADGD